MTEVVSILPYHSGSKSVLSLALALNGMDFPVIGDEGRISQSTPNRTGLKFKILREPPAEADKNRKIINWGNSYAEKKFIHFNKDISGPDHFLQKKILKHSGGNQTYVSRVTDLYGFNSYKVVTEPDGNVIFPYFPKSQEYHVHFWGKDIFLCEHKYHRLRSKDNKIVGKEYVNWKIRSYNNGFLLRETDKVPDAVIKEVSAILDSGKLSPDFGVLKFLYSIDRDEAALYEYSPTPILYKQHQVMAYANQIRKVVK